MTYEGPAPDRFAGAPGLRTLADRLVPTVGCPYAYRRSNPSRCVGVGAMSVQAISWVLDHSESTGNDRCVLISIANHADRLGRNAWPSRATIALESRCSLATVRRSIQNLRQLGELDWVPGGGQEGARRKSNLYRLPKMRGQSDPASDDKGSTGTDKGSDSTPQGVTRDPRTVLNRSIEPGESPAEPEPNGEGKAAFDAVVVELAQRKKL